LSALSFDAVTKTYTDGTHALADVSLDVTAGEIVVLLGASGCGKTSLLRIAAGLEEASSGSVSLDGTPISKPHPKIGMVFQEARLMPWLTAAQNVAFGLPSAQAETAETILARVGLASQGRKLPRDLSGGQQQRVALARALVTKPEILLLDEPFSALDAMTREDLQDHLLDLWAVDRPTIVLVTHDIDEAVVLADRIAVMTPNPGRLTSVVVNPLARPRNRDDARLLVFKQDLRALLQRRYVDRQQRHGNGSMWASFGAGL
jgi:sulfonate transport system ATP-binding protein